MKTTLSADQLSRRIAETRLWHISAAKAQGVAYSGRSTDLRPPAYRMIYQLGVGFGQVVEAVADQRAFWLFQSRQDIEAKFFGLQGERLLLCTSATESIPDGAVTQESNGFYDEEDLPPWDTWLAYFTEDNREFLLSWVPPMWIEPASIGVEMHFMGCLSWADESELKCIQQWRDAGCFSR